MCLMCECMTKLRLRCVTPSLSLSKEGGSRKEVGSRRDTPSSSRSDSTHAIFDVVAARARYSASVEDWTTFFCLQVH